MPNILLSIIAPNYNDHLGLERTIKSVKEQNSANTDHINIDGDYDDASKEIVLEHRDSFS